MSNFIVVRNVRFYLCTKCPSLHFVRKVQCTICRVTPSVIAGKNVSVASCARTTYVFEGAKTFFEQQRGLVFVKHFVAILENYT